jgi:thiamine pyrophosphate-dependent acetolactate synthase large subunit-like protein
MSAEPICGADMVIKALVDQGVDVVFGYPGGAVLPIYDSLFKQNRRAARCMPRRAMPARPARSAPCW